MSDHGRLSFLDFVEEDEEMEGELEYDNMEDIKNEDFQEIKKELLSWKDFNKELIVEFLDYVSDSLRDAYCKIIAYGYSRDKTYYRALVKSDKSITIVHLENKCVSIDHYQHKKLIRYWKGADSITFQHKITGDKFNNDTISFEDKEMVRKSVKFFMNLFD